MSEHLNETLIAGGAAICGGLVGGLVTGVYGHLRDWRTKPELHLDYLNDSRTRTDSTYFDNGQRIEEIFIRARLSNVGRRSARGCRVFLANIQEVHNEHIADTIFCDPDRLKWPGHPPDYEPRDIPRGIFQYVDIVSVRKNVPGWRFHIRQLLDSQSLLKNYKGVFQLTLVATADNADPFTLLICAEYHQDWHHFRAWVP